MADQQPSNTVPPASGFTTIGNELDPMAPLWRVYRDEVRNHDQNVTFDEWNKTLDILLIFAGLFSAVVTSFLVASYPLLTPEDPNAAVVNAIHALAMAINSSITLPRPQAPDPVTVSTVWVNGLWFTSLFLSLAVAFFAILAKQWLVEYNHRMADPPAAVAASSSADSNTTTSSPPTPYPSSNTPSQPLARFDAMSPTASLVWARRRQFFFAAFSDWHIPVLITQTLPFLLHVALFLFLVGLSIFVSTLNRPIACGVSALTGSLFCLYFIATVLPVFHADCPTATPLVRRTRDAPTWIAIKAVQFWDIVLSIVFRIALGAFGLSCVRSCARVASRNMAKTIDDLRGRRIRNLGWHKSAGTADDEVKLDTLRWLILVSGSETAVTAAFQALGALSADSPFLPALRTITAGMDTAVERLGNSQITPTAVEIVRAVRSEFILGRGSWDLPLLGLDLSSSFTKTLQESQHPDARLLSAAMHLDGTLYTHGRSFTSLYDLTDALLRGEGSLDSCLSTAHLLVDCADIPEPAFVCLSVFLARSLQLSDSDKAVIFRIFDRLRKKQCHVTRIDHTCGLLCAVVFMVSALDLDDPATLRIVPIIISHLLPHLTPTPTKWDSDLGLLTMEQNERFFQAIARSNWLQSPCPPGDTDVEVLSSLLWQLDWAFEPASNSYPNLLEWLMPREQYLILRNPHLIEKLRETLTCDPDKRPFMLQYLCYIVHKVVKPKGQKWLTAEAEISVCTFISSLISLCQDLSPYNDAKTADVLFSLGLVPEIGACLDRLGPSPLDIRSKTCKEFFDMVKTALGSLDEVMENKVEKKEEYLLHLAQHCFSLDSWWTRREEVDAHLDVSRMEEMLVQHGPCTKCTEGSVDKWSEDILFLLRIPTVKQGPQPGPSTLPPHDAPFTLPAPSASAILPTTASPPDVASSSSITAIPNAVSVFCVDSAATSIIQAATASGPFSSSAGSNPVIASLSVPPGYAVLVSSLNSTPAIDAPSRTTPHAVISPSLAATATPHIATAPIHICAHEVPPATASPPGLDDIGSRVLSQPGPASRSDGTFTVHVAYDSPSDLPASSVGQGHGGPVAHASSARNTSAVSSPADRAVDRSGSSDVSSDSAPDVLTVGAATHSRSVLESSADAAATTTPSPYPPVAHSQARAVNVHPKSASSSDSEWPDDDIDVTAGSATA